VLDRPLSTLEPNAGKHQPGRASSVLRISRRGGSAYDCAPACPRGTRIKVFALAGFFKTTLAVFSFTLTTRLGLLSHLESAKASDRPSWLATPALSQARGRAMHKRGVQRQPGVHAASKRRVTYGDVPEQGA
jgi:hypothetical protein